MVRPLVYDRAALDAAVFAQINDAANRGARAPSTRNIGLAIHARREAVRASLARLVAAGRIVDRGAVKAPAWLVPETGRETARTSVGRPPSAHNRKGGGTNLTPSQREVLSVARQLARQGIEICAATVAPRIGRTREGALSRLHRVAGNGYLRPTDPGRFELVDAETVKRAAPQPVTDVIEIDGRPIRRTRYPAMIAEGALLYGCGAGRGMTSLSETGGRRLGGRAA